MAQKSPGPAEPESTFETAIARLENIVEAMESEKIPLEELLLRYEEGIKLVRICQEKLESAEKRIEMISKGAGGKLQVTPFEPAANSDPVSGAGSTPVQGEVTLF